MSQSRLVGFRRRLTVLFDDDAPPSRAAHIFNAGLALIILCNVGLVVIESVAWIRERYDSGFWHLEQAATAIFAVEYLLRVWTCVDLRSGRFRHPLWGRLRYGRSFFALVDLVSVLPGVLGLLGASDLRVLRLLRLLRLLKLTRHSAAFSLLWAVFREEARSISAVLFILCLTLTMSASLMYMVEGEAQPELFSSIPAAMWWAIETVTTVGYGDMVPVTVVGKILGGVVSVVGIGTLALFSGIITVSFMDQLKLRRDQYHRLVEVNVSGGRLSAGRVRAIERIGDRLGLPPSEAEEIVREVLAETHGLPDCPHCGKPLADHARVSARA